MKMLLTIGLILTLNVCYCFASGLNRLEIWGWNGTKEEFRNLYFEKTGVDLENSYACSAVLSEMGFMNSMSIVYPDDLQSFLAGKTDWKTTDRLVIIRDFPENRFTKMLTDTVFQNELELLSEKVKADPDLIFRKSHLEDFRNFELILMGTLIPWNKNNSLRDKSNTLISGIKIGQIDFQSNTFEIINAMLTTPDPATGYNAMKLIGYLYDRQHIGDKLNLANALTLKDFLSSNLQTFQSDAVAFLGSIYPERATWTAKKWKDWLKKTQ